MKIRENLDIIVEIYPYYKTLNTKLLVDVESADYNDYGNAGGTSRGHSTTKGTDGGLYSSTLTTSKNIDYINSWVLNLLTCHYPELNPPPDPLRIRNTWFVRDGVGDSTKPHYHNPCIFSWVYFVKCPRGSSPLVFTTSWKRIKAEEGKMVLFPSMSYHHVPKNRCDDRVVLVGNVEMEGFVWVK